MEDRKAYPEMKKEKRNLFIKKIKKICPIIKGRGEEDERTAKDL